MTTHRHFIYLTPALRKELERFEASSALYAYLDATDNDTEQASEDRDDAAVSIAQALLAQCRSPLNPEEAVVIDMSLEDMIYGV